jgi:molybdopterin-guanine dinucleotide biosynthesis protein A
VAAVEAIVLAGGRPDDPLARRLGVPSKCFVPFRGRPLVEHVLEALAASGLTTLVVGPEHPLEPAPRLQLPDRGGMLENLEAALEVAHSDKVLVASGDMPFLSAEAIRYILGQAPKAGLVYCAVRKEEIERSFPGMRRTYARLKEGSFTGGNVILLDKALFSSALGLARKVVALRKNPLALAQRIGWGVLFKLLLGRLSIPELEARVSRLLGMPARALVVPFAGVGVDIDEEEDLVWLERGAIRASQNR